MKDFCPKCEEMTEVESVRTREEVLVRGETFSVYCEYFRCTLCNSEFEKSGSGIDPLAEAYKKYQVKHDMITSDKMIKFRKNYDLTQKELSELLGWGGATLSRYENGALQDDAHDRALRLAMEPEGLRTLIRNDRKALTEEKRQRILDIIDSNRNTRTSLLDYLKAITNYDPGILSGFRKMDIRKLFGTIEFLCKGNDGIPKTKLNKLLFYADFKHFKENGVSITGARYARLPFGPVLNDYEHFFATLIHEEGLIAVEERSFSNGANGEYYSTSTAPDIELLSDSELGTLLGIKEYFRNISATRISELSHNEPAFINTENSNLISYEHAELLSI